MLAFQICDPAPRRFPTGRNWRGSSNRKLRPPISGRFVTDEFAATIEDPNICRPLERKNSQSETVHVFAWKSSMEIGRESCRERVCPYVEISVVAVSLKKK